MKKHFFTAALLCLAATVLFGFSATAALELPFWYDGPVEDWTAEDFDTFEQIYGSDLSGFFFVGDLDGYSPEKVEAYISAHPGLLAGGVTLSPDGSASLDGQGTQSPSTGDFPNIPVDKDGEKENHGEPSVSEEKKSSTPILFAVTVAVFILAAAVLIPWNKIIKKHNAEKGNNEKEGIN